MSNLNLIDELILGEQFNLDRENKEKILLKVIPSQLEENSKNPNIKSMYEKLGVNVREIKKLQDVPYIPVNMFKEFNLSVCRNRDIVRVLTSSATTTGIPSKIYLDKKTSIRQAQGLITTLANFVGAERRPLLVIDNEDSNKRGESITARGTAIRGVSTFASNITYVMDKELELDIDKLYEFQEKYRNQEVLVYGFTYIVWSKFVKVLMEKGLKLDMPKLKLLHSGGWKKLISQKIEKDEFNMRIARIFNTSPSNIIDFYGMVEQVGVVFLDCKYGHKHVANFADIIIRDIQSLEEVKPGGIGIIEVMSILGSSYPAQAILTEDIGQLIGVDDCPCGRKGKYFKFKARVEKAEVRGCGDTFAEMEREI